MLVLLLVFVTSFLAAYACFRRLCSSPRFLPLGMPVFLVYALTYARFWDLIFGCLCLFSSIMLAIWRDFDISSLLYLYCLTGLRCSSTSSTSWRCWCWGDACDFYFYHMSATTEDDRLGAGSVSPTSIPSTEESSEHEPDLYPASKSSKRLLTLDIALPEQPSVERGASRAQSTAVSVYSLTLCSLSCFSFFFLLFLSYFILSGIFNFCIFVFLSYFGERTTAVYHCKAKMFICCRIMLGLMGICS